MTVTSDCEGEHQAQEFELDLGGNGEPLKGLEQWSGVARSDMCVGKILAGVWGEWVEEAWSGPVDQFGGCDHS